MSRPHVPRPKSVTGEELEGPFGEVSPSQPPSWSAWTIQREMVRRTKSIAYSWCCEGRKRAGGICWGVEGRCFGTVTASEGRKPERFGKELKKIILMPFDDNETSPIQLGRRLRSTSRDMVGREEVSLLMVATLGSSDVESIKINLTLMANKSAGNKTVRANVLAVMEENVEEIEELLVNMPR